MTGEHVDHREIARFAQERVKPIRRRGSDVPDPGHADSGNGSRRTFPSRRCARVARRMEARRAETRNEARYAVRQPGSEGIAPFSYAQGGALRVTE